MSWYKCPFAGVPWCKCTLVGVSWCQCTLVGVPWCKCTLIGVPWCKYTLVGVPWCKCTLVGVQMYPYRCAVMQMYPYRCAMMQIYPCRCAMMQMYPCRCAMIWMPPWECHDASIIYSKISFIFDMRLPQCLKPKYFQTQFIILEKSSSFWLKAPQKNWWSLLENLRMGHSNDLAQKIYFHNLVRQSGGGTFPRSFLEKWILWKSSILKRFIFVVPEYGNLTSIKTHRDRLENSGGEHSGARSSNFWFWRG